MFQQNVIFCVFKHLCSSWKIPQYLVGTVGGQYKHLTNISIRLEHLQKIE